MADVEAAEPFKAPGNLTELHTYVSYMKDKSGIHGWTAKQRLLQVSLFTCLELLLSQIYHAIIFILLQYCGNNTAILLLQKKNFIILDTCTVILLQ